jgi:LuxR family maltose regulon positive regulatory protein
MLRLADVLAHPLTLISAPAGFGKTTLLAEWMHNFRFEILDFGADAGAVENPKSKFQPPKFSWLSLDEGDNDPIRFWSYMATGFESACQGAGKPLLEALQAAQPLPIEAMLTLLINGLAQTQQEIVLLLDDYHAIHSQPIHEGVQFLVQHQPPNVHLILLTRRDPPLPLARWRVRGRLLELRAADLRFTQEEAAAFFNQMMDLALSAEQIAVLEARTEGWIAGLQLAALSMKGDSDFAGFINAFTGSNRYVLDYLVDEVFQRLPAATQTFLLRTSLLNRLHAALCNVLTERNDSHALLLQLERENLFLVALDEDRTWWRYHGLFADVLRSRLQETQPELAPVLHRRAAEWYVQRGWLPNAIHHAFAAGDLTLVAGLIE